ncbi:YCF48-related protein [Wenzhouxiangella marina]|uniref:Photosynthesis system II assembly factor Ycf48/Hcf136-like domain-containing protein n=1 Tax=Wenzhouxiangella marina TaxID=1579979 RepID=A0A0K0XZA7_9GAMM|nr:YCF48-related protein [Wenzhouxiangella marina]AKS42956.1 hypothetical protein WM2015_2598 [Wenzhouxiangella marina]MBB6087360.1 photosystem II stability/assembly factor-like uncharacterized protein [Wenzhouxiangella marina]
MISRILPLAILLLVLPAAVSAQSAEPQPAEQARLVASSLLLDVTRAGQRFVAVGERGHVLLSSDGDAWEQAESVPTRATLTRVTFAGGRLWAVGHDSVIIHSRDMGRSWTLQNFEPDWEKPLLDVHFFDANRGVAIGAYGLYMRTDNAGEDWEVFDMADLVTSEAIDWEEAAQAAAELDSREGNDEMLGLDDELYDPAADFDRGCYEFMECHLNAFLDLGDGRWMIAAERGYGFRTVDGGENWESFRFPYPGSMFGLLDIGDGSVLAFGLRGNVQLSNDFGSSWALLDSPLESTLMGGDMSPEGRPFMVGAGAARLSYDPRSQRFEYEEDRLGSTYAAVLFLDDGSKIIVGEDGVSHD